MSRRERLRYIRNWRNLTQKELGVEVGFNESNADIRISQYENGARNPRKDTIEKMAKVLQVDPWILAEPEVDYEKMVQALIILEDAQGVKIERRNGKLALIIDEVKGAVAPALQEALVHWADKADAFKEGLISEDEYNEWRYNFPKCLD
jgi:transcriptional regulator with XRE-family HTH domain